MGNCGKEVYVLDLEIITMIPTAQSYKNINGLCSRESTDRNLKSLSPGKNAWKRFCLTGK